jgi:hypothetical protein
MVVRVRNIIGIDDAYGLSPRQQTLADQESIFDSILWILAEFR